MYLQVSDGADGLADPELAGPDPPGAPGTARLGLRGLDGVWGRIGAWRALLDRPLTSYYLVLGITMLLLGLGLVMVLSTASVIDLSAGLSPYSDFKKQLLGAAIGLPLMWVAARSRPRLFRAFAYPLLAVAIVGLGLTLIHGVSVSQNGAARWIEIGGQQVQPSEIAKLALVVWGADLLARKDKLGQLADWRHMLVPLLPGTAVLCLLVMTGDDLGTTFILLVIFLALLWVIGTPGRVFAGMLILAALAVAFMMVSSKYRMDRILGFLDPQGGPTGPYMQSIQGKYALGSGGITGVGLGASGEKWGWVPESTSDYIFAILGEELGLIGTLCVTFLYGLLAFAGLRIARRVPDLFSRLAATGITAWIVMQAVVNIGVVIGVLPIFVPYTGAKPVAKGWNNKRGRAEKGRADTHVTAHDGRAVCFVTGEPSGLSVTLPKALAELKKAAGPGAAIMVGFDRGGAYPQVFAHCRDQQVHWVTYRRAPLAVPAALPVITAVTYAGRTRQVAWAEETVQLKDYGQARQITLFEHGRVALQILTSDFGACPADILSWLKSRWREENFLKYASENYGIDKICDYLASIETNTKLIRNPARDQANAAVRDAEKTLAAAERGLAALLADPGLAPAAKNARIPGLQEDITRARAAAAAAVTARKPIPAKLPASDIDPDAETALLRAGRRGLQMVLRLLAHNAEHWLSGHLNAYLRDDDEYRAITRQTIIRGLAGTITWTPAAITVQLDQPGSARVTRALALLIDEINATPPAMPGDSRPITCHLAPRPAI